MSVDTILSLIRAGALEEAEREYLRLGLHEDKSSEDAVALAGRILKARALEQSGDERRRLALKAAERYGEAHALTGGSYSGINTAALYLLAGRTDEARRVARNMRKAVAGPAPAPGEAAYYHAATAAEAELILGNQAQAERMLADAVALDPHNHVAHASTLKQFEMLLAETGAVQDWLDPFRPPKALHFAGHMFGLEGAQAALDSAAQYGLEKAVDDLLTADRYGAAYGALAAGSDIVIAERLLATGATLHVVQPCPDALFARLSLDPYGAGWRARFDACIDAAASVRHISADETLCDHLTTAFASETAMGLAVLEAERVATRAEQLLIWDGRQASADTGTARDAALWDSTGRRQHIVRYPAPRSTPETLPSAAGSERTLKAMLFADVRGFSGLSEVQVPLFLNHILEPLARSVEALSEPPERLNTWGDGLFMVFGTVEAAAAAALALQHTCRGVNLSASGLPAGLALRVGGHFGPVHQVRDPFLQETGYLGREVTTAARIEPQAAPGAIFVSEPFACALAVRSNAFRCEPVTAGVRPGEGPFFSLRGRTARD